MCVGVTFWLSACGLGSRVHMLARGLGACTALKSLKLMGTCLPHSMLCLRAMNKCLLPVCLFLTHTA